MKIFVTGATGFIGSHFLSLAMAMGHEITALRRTVSRTSGIQLPVQPLWVDSDLNQVDSSYFHDIDCIVHFAAHTGNVPYDTLPKCLYWKQ